MLAGLSSFPEPHGPKRFLITIAVMLLAAIFENGVRIFAWEIYPVFNSPYSWNRAEAGTALRW